MVVGALPPVRRLGPPSTERIKSEISKPVTCWLKTILIRLIGPLVGLGETGMICAVGPETNC